jgi:hypothetical protein
MFLRRRMAVAAAITHKIRIFQIMGRDCGGRGWG